MTKTAILYVTFSRDLEFLEHSLKSFRKYCSGFSRVTIVVPEHELGLFLPLEERYGTKECPVLIRNFLEHPGKGFLHHEVMECYADVHHPDADFTLHCDPDCLWIKPTTPDDYLVNGKPVLLIEPFEAIKKAGHAGRYGWKKIVESAVGFPVDYETMCRHPAVHHKAMYRKLRDHMESVHQTTFANYVLIQQNKFPQGFAEFPTMGAIAIKFFSDHYHFIDRGFDGEKHDPVPHLEQMWSYQYQSGIYHARIKEILS